ncbi:MAG: hypothetical protein CSYNP_03690 [Syntrophus sp. SKADARSKE-3]|nr:hypothetical protein [Syntrophus sp. SKADARSKE-3]
MKVNTTEHYHRHEIQTLGWELTVCNSLINNQSPCRRILNSDKSYGFLLFTFLDQYFALNKINRVLEVGGGYGYLMKDFLDINPMLSVTMVDISPHLLNHQKELLSGYNIDFLLEDFLETDLSNFPQFDLAVLNENVGDFPTVVDIRPEQLLQPSPVSDSHPFSEVARFFNRYKLDIPHTALFNFNIGAAKAIEKLCLSQIPSIFISEHSCEATAPDFFHSILRFSPADTPERISLKGHDEYTIQFSHLDKIARAFDYEVKRGPLADYIPFELTDHIRCSLAAPAPRTDNDEIIRDFIGDLYKYEYLLLIKQNAHTQAIKKT